MPPAAAAAATQPRPSRSPSRPATRRRRPQKRQARRSRSGPKMTVYRSASARIPVAAGRAAGAVRELPDSGALVRLTRGRLWIGLLGTMLAGIVGLNVLSLGLNATSGRIGQQASELERANSALRAEIAEKLSAAKVESAAATLGLGVPAATEITYLDYRESDLARAARVMSSELVALAEDPEPSAFATSLEQTEPSYVAPSVTPEPATPTVPAPSSTTSPSTTAPSTTTPAPAADTGGGVAAGL